MTDKNLTEIAVILDRSGSMESIREDMTGGYDTFVREQAKLPGRCVMSLYQFDSAFEVVYQEIPAPAVPPLELKPRGSTALLDACGRAVALIGERLEAKPERERPSKVVVLVITDGHENASREYTAEQIRAVFERQRVKYDWQFVYLGANVDAFHEARQVGASAAMNFQSSKAGVARAYKGIMGAVGNYRSSSAGGQSITSSSIQEAADAPDEPNQSGGN